MPTFISGQELGRRLFDKAVVPILARHAPGLRYAAALVGPGSEVLGYDTERSTDHNRRAIYTPMLSSRRAVHRYVP
jgi:hypothetical protein